MLKFWETMSVSTSQISFLATAQSLSSSPLISRRQCRSRSRRTNNLIIHSPNIVLVAASASADNRNRLAKLAILTLAAGVLTLGSVHDASAAKTGGRVGGQAFRSAPPRPSSPRINNNSRTNIYINPRVAPPLVGGYGYGYGVPYYGGWGWGWSPFSFFTPSGPSVAVGIGGGGGFDTLLLFIFLGTVAAFATRLFNGTTKVDQDDDDS